MWQISSFKWVCGHTVDLKLICIVWVIVISATLTVFLVQNPEESILESVRTRSVDHQLLATPDQNKQMTVWCVCKRVNRWVFLFRTGKIISTPAASPQGAWPSRRRSQSQPWTWTRWNEGAAAADRKSSHTCSETWYLLTGAFIVKVSPQTDMRRRSPICWELKLQCKNGSDFVFVDWSRYFSTATSSGHEGNCSSRLITLIWTEFIFQYQYIMVSWNQMVKRFRASTYWSTNWLLISYIHVIMFLIPPLPSVTVISAALLLPF